MDDGRHGASGPNIQRAEIEKLKKINRALMGRVERSMDLSGSAFSLFQTAILLEDKVKARTRELEETLAHLSDAYARLEDTRDEAETAKQNLTAAIEAISEGFALFDADEKLVMCNAPFMALLPDISAQLSPGLEFARAAKMFSSSVHLKLDEGQSPQTWFDTRITLFRKPYASFIQQFSGDRWIQVSNRKTTSGATVILQTDITATVRGERVRHERELDEQSKILQATINHLPQGICMFSKSLQLRAWNWRLIELLGLPFKQISTNASFHAVLDMLSSASFGMDPVTVEKIERWVSEPKPQGLSGVEITRGDGLILSIGANVMPDGGIVVTFTNVTQERRTTLALREANETLEQRVEERTAELRREIVERRMIEAELLHAKNAAEDANKGKTRFLAAASHDLLQPLNASRIFLSLLLETGLNSRQARLAESADRAFQSVEQLLESLLDISRFDTGGVETNVGVFSLGGLFETLVAEFQPLAERKRLMLRHVPTTLCIRSDHGLLRRIIQNFLSNAIRYTEQGKVLLGAKRSGDKVRIEVWDTGPGIPEDKQNFVFEEFRRLHKASGSETKAMGLGLAIVDRIAKHLDHQVSLQSVPGKGSRFGIEAPRSEGVATVRNEHSNAPVTNAGIGTLVAIVIENDLQILEGMVELLKFRGIEAIPAVSVEEAAEVLESLGECPDIVIADYHLDDGTGADAIRLVRQACRSPVPAIIITADHTSAVQSELAMEGVSLLWKPIRTSNLIETVAKLVG